MFPFLCCLGRRRKADTQDPDNPNQKSSLDQAVEAQAFTSDNTGSPHQLTREIEPKKQGNLHDCASRSPLSFSTGKKSCHSFVMSHSSTTFNQFCHNFGSPDPANVSNESRLFIDFGWRSSPTKSKLSSLNLQIKCTDLDPHRSLTIPEEDEESPSNRLHRPSYSDDPFAAPTPRGATFTRRYCDTSRDDSATISSYDMIAPAHQIDVNEVTGDSTILAPLEQAKLPTIPRVSRLSLGDWFVDLPKDYSVMPQSRSRLSSVARGSMFTSPSFNFPTTNELSNVNTPRIPNNQTCYLTGDSN